MLITVIRKDTGNWATFGLVFDAAGQEFSRLPDNPAQLSRKQRASCFARLLARYTMPLPFPSSSSIVFTERVSREGKAIGSVCSSVRLSVCLSVCFYFVEPTDFQTSVCVCMCTLGPARLALKVQVIDEG